MATTPGAPRSRRIVELFLLLFAVGIAAFGYIQIGTNRDGSPPPDTVRNVVGLGVLALIAHGFVWWRARYADPLLLPAAVLLNGLGLVLIARLDLETPSSQAAGTQMLWSALGVLFFIVVVVFLKDYRHLQRYTYIFAVLAILLLVLPMFFPATYGARIWVRLGPLSFQPGEFTKILLTVFFSGYLATRAHTLTLTGKKIWRFQFPSARVLAPILLIWLVSVLVLVAETDLGMSLLFFGVFIVLLYVATGRGSWFAITLGLAAVGAVAVGWLEPHVHSRVEDWLHPLASIEQGLGANQLAQSMFAFAAGGMLGTGLGLGHSILIGFAAKSDFILATAGEELGLTGLTALFLVYTVVVSRGYRAAVAVRDPFGTLLAIGLASLLAIQVFVVAGGVTDLIPLTGMTMPFLAQGGSSVVTNWIIIALLVKLTDHARGPEAPMVPLGPLGPLEPMVPPAKGPKGPKESKEPKRRGRRAKSEPEPEPERKEAD
ncbi:cell division protein FtsW [Mangrovactinospora gilvigrisea]|uniref:Cell division protein FtsW n=1 Tax=Mangrovactinospora gilvigrisea TaxID=1428644 RepID=A0A1J7BEU2_9ACTN|nr:FtsW/RodA/SpoVE family cell cycle protein [Mangrovactinospora gilvigrisea]OIV37203.1 cell division protein FtsW [Mangrovactinospora gilvigrisea]